MPESKNQPVQKAKNNWVILVVILAIAIIAAAGIYWWPKIANVNQDNKNTTANTTSITNTIEKIFQPTAAQASKFATYEAVAVNVTPKVPAYTVNQDLSNVTNAGNFSLSDEQKNLLVKNSFTVASPGWSDEFFKIYESNRYGYTPSFVTTDSMLHTYHLFFDYLLKRVEIEKLAPELKTLNAAMLSAAQAQYNELKGTDWENAAKRNVGFFSVASKLLDSSVKVPDIVKNEVDQELAFIEAHQQIRESPVMNIGRDITKDTIDTPQGKISLAALSEDYSQYIPRGHYTKSDLLKAYFKTMMWHGRLTFRFKNPDEVKSAALIVLNLNQEKNSQSWDKIYEPTNFFVGKSDDITFYQLKDAVEKNYSQLPSLKTLTTDTTKFNSLFEAANNLEAPQINSMPIFSPGLQPDREKEIKGFRFMGQRFTIDASIFQRLLYREVGNKHGVIPPAPDDTTRMMPKGLDVTAAMGSDEAYNILKSYGEDQYYLYPENMAKMKKYIAELPNDNWTQNLYWGWLYSLKPLTEAKSEGYPSFMKNDAWVRKELNTYLGSWTELKHDTILYAKQVYAELGGGPPEQKDDRGYVEPNPDVYARLASLLKMTNEGLQMRGLISDANKDNLGKLEQLSLSLKTITEKELNNTALSDDDYELIRSYGGQLEHFWLDVSQEELTASGLNQYNFLQQNPAALVADVATDPNGQVLEEATGHIADIYVVVPVDGKLRIAKGGVYTYYEFPWPLSDRLTDEKWREILNSENKPSLPDWTSAFMAQ